MWRDESRLCCNVVAMRQAVIARGKLVKTRPPPYLTWQLTDVSVRELPK